MNFELFCGETKPVKGPETRGEGLYALRGSGVIVESESEEWKVKSNWSFVANEGCPA